MDRQQLLIVLTVLSLMSVSIKGRRTNRIIFGRILLDRQLYSAINYYVWIRDLHHCGYVYGHGFYVKRNSHPCPPNAEFLKCGGVLLTPTIVQTACHCVAVFIHREKQVFSGAKEQKPWEKMYLIYPGWSDVTMMNIGMISSRYYVHSKCSEVNWEGTTGQRGRTSIRFALHNYGLIAMKDSVEDYAPISNRFSYAPLYTQVGIAQLWREAASKEYTCLFFGFGNYNRFVTGRKTILDEQQATYMRFGWRIITNYYDCYDFTYPPEVRTHDFKFDYRQNATWSCAVSHNKTTDTFLAQGGDSGGPVTCNGEYYGIIGEPSNITANPAVTITSPIAFTVYENSKRFRPNFMKFVQKLNDEDYPPSPTYDPVPPRPRHYSTRSMSTPLKNHTKCVLTVFLLTYQVNILNLSKYLLFF